MGEGFDLIKEPKILAVEKIKNVRPIWMEHSLKFSLDPADKSDFEGYNLKQIKKLLRPRLRALLKENRINHLFPVQRCVIFKLLHNYSPVLNACYRPRDICVKAPTGSGKTLAYALPIINIFEKNHTNNLKIKPLRALILLPTKELAHQVYRVFVQYTRNIKIKIVLLSGNQNIETERNILYKGGRSPDLTHSAELQFYQNNMGYFDKIDNDFITLNNDMFGYMSLLEPQCNADIVISTPGRLIDHIYHTPGFDLSSLQFLVIDEADRLLQDVKQDWLYHLNNAIHNGQYNSECVCDNDILKHFKNDMSAIAQTRPPQKLLFSATFSNDPVLLAKLDLFRPIMCEAIAQKSGNVLNDQNMDIVPVIKYTLPPSLHQYYLECPEKAIKPLYFLWFLTNLKTLMKTSICSNELDQFIDTEFRILCFTKSTQASIRLAQLLNLSGVLAEKVSHIISRNEALRNRRILQQFQAPSINLLQTSPNNTLSTTSKKRKNNPSSSLLVHNLKVLICSDLMARGMDININDKIALKTNSNICQPDKKDYKNNFFPLIIVNYDVPIKIKNYVHRCGRTARAGKQGFAFTLIEENQLPNFKAMFCKAEWCNESTFDSFCQPLPSPSSDTNVSNNKLIPLDQLQPLYEKSLKIFRKNMTKSILYKK